MSVRFSDVDLVVDRVYEGSRQGNASDDPLPKLVGVDSGAGFRHLGNRSNTSSLRLLVLKTTFSDPAWPDSLDKENGLFTWYGDNRSAGELHNTPRGGNAILRGIFDACHSSGPIDRFPPIFLFGGTGEYRDVRFLGLAVPGAEGMTADEDLVAVWRTTTDGVRFQNYRAVFTILDVSVVRRAWITDIQAGRGLDSPHSPGAWLDWVKRRKYRTLKTAPEARFRTPAKQRELDDHGRSILGLVYERFKGTPTGFERAAVEIAKLAMPDIRSCELTRPWRDGGRDATGLYRVGQGPGGIDVEFALEAKCYALSNGVGVRDISRLISRLRHRQFGILVTTSFVGTQAYRELTDDGHPVVVLCAADVADILRTKVGGEAEVAGWLDRLDVGGLA